MPKFPRLRVGRDTALYVIFHTTSMNDLRVSRRYRRRVCAPRSLGRVVLLACRNNLLRLTDKGQDPVRQ